MIANCQIHHWMKEIITISNSLTCPIGLNDFHSFCLLCCCYQPNSHLNIKSLIFHIFTARVANKKPAPFFAPPPLQVICMNNKIDFVVRILKHKVLVLLKESRLNCRAINFLPLLSQSSTHARNMRFNAGSFISSTSTPNPSSSCSKLQKEKSKQCTTDRVTCHTKNSLEISIAKHCIRLGAINLLQCLLPDPCFIDPCRCVHNCALLC